jgi:hypothetical protein
MGEERSDHTLQATALVHGAYLRLVDTTKVLVSGEPVAFLHRRGGVDAMNSR